MIDRWLFVLAGAAALLGGGLRVAMAFVPWDASNPWIELVALKIDLLLLFGLIGIFLAERERVGVPGVIGFALALSGIASIVGPDTTAFGIDTYMHGVLVILVGLTLLSVAMLLKRAGSALAAICWILSLAAGVVGGAMGQSELGFFAGGILFGLGFVAAGLALIFPGNSVSITK